MSVQPTTSMAEHAHRGDDLYNRVVRQQVEAEHQGEIVAIDIDTGDFEVAPRTLDAARSLRSRKPMAQIWFVRIGHPTVHRFGAARVRESA